MDHILELVVILTVCGTFFLIGRLLQRLLVTPVPKDKNTLLHMIIAARGDGSSLEQTIQSLIWLRDEGNMPMELIICDCGLDENGRQLMELAAGKWNIAYCKTNNPDGLIGDITWQKETPV